MNSHDIAGSWATLLLPINSDDSIDYGALAGVKVCDGDTDWYTRMKQYCPGMSIFVPGHRLATGIQNGAHGAYSNMACLNPAAAQRWYRQMLSSPAESLELESRVQQFMTECIFPFIYAGYSNMAVDKFLAAVGGWGPVTERLRWPYHSIEQSAATEIREKARRIIPEFMK